jgi:hypothetical protein
MVENDIVQHNNVSRLLRELVSSTVETAIAELQDR